MTASRSGRMVMISGCSGGGKSTLLDELARRGFATFEEPGRRIVKEQLASGGDALPWTNPRAFIELAVRYSIENWERAQQIAGICFFDRGIIDAANYFLRFGAPMPAYVADAIERCRYHPTVYMMPPWKEIFATDPERRHPFEEAAKEYQSLLSSYARFGYDMVIVPKLSVCERAEFILKTH